MENRNSPNTIDEDTAVAAACLLNTLTKKNCTVIKIDKDHHQLILEDVDPVKLDAFLKQRNIYIKIIYTDEKSMKNALIIDPKSILMLANLQLSPPKLSSSSITSSEHASHKHAQLFTRLKQLSEEEASGKMSSTVYISRKNPSFSAQKNAKKFKHIWYEKISPSLELAERETAVQELSRLIVPHYPKTRVLIHDANEISVVSKGVAGFKSIATIPPNVFHDAIINGTYQGLGEASLMSLYLWDIDFKIVNTCLDLYDRVIKFDGDWCFPLFRDQGFAKHNFDITERTLDELPFPSNYEAFNWLDARVENTLNLNPKFISMDICTNEMFRYEVNKTILKCILLPSQLTAKLINHYISDKTHSKKLINVIEERQQQLYKAACNNSSFREFILHDESIKDLINHFSQQLYEFKMTGKMLLIEPLTHQLNKKFPIKDKIIEDFYILKNKIEAITKTPTPTPQPTSQPVTPGSSPRKTSFLSSSIKPTTRESPSTSKSPSSSEKDDDKNRNSL